MHPEVRSEITGSSMVAGKTERSAALLAGETGGVPHGWPGLQARLHRGAAGWAKRGL